MTRLPVVDAHHHLWNTDEGDYPWMVGPFAALRGVHDMTELAPLLHSSNVRSTVVVQARADIQESIMLLQAAATYQQIAGVVGWVDLTSSHVDEQLETLRSGFGGEHLVGIRHGVADEADPGWLERDDVVRGLHAVSEAGLAFDLEITERELASAVALADRLPELRLVVDHLAKPTLRDGIHHEWLDGLSAIAARPNVSAKISGLITEAAWDRWTVDDLQLAVDLALEVFGPPRLMFGSDWPVCELAGTYDTVLAAAEDTLAALSIAEQAHIFHENAQALYQLSTHVRSR
ncbi:amidohydrolase family protein [Leifsonia xyli]|uniref:amidohydrolase family protein n=1 Tax=Leifsonia xyli TaxID=1575 RepID=UPI003D67D960